MVKNNNALVFENVWRKNVFERQEIKSLWRQFNPGLEEKKAEERLGQIVWLVKNEFNQVVGISTAQKVYIKQLRNYLYSVRLLVIPFARQPGLATKLLVMTRDFLEAMHVQDGHDKCIGIITLVENNEYAALRREAIWKASQMVYIGNSGKGRQVRVYYFKGALIA